MPLKASLNGITIYAFNYSNEEWESLRSESLQMSCCEAKGILKTSKLGTQFFAHHKKGNCFSEGETTEHLYLKNLIATVAKRNGWEVYTEREGVTPGGERWIADVYCTKDTVKLAIEVQWSYQTLEEFQCRQEKYTESGVRAAWLYRLKGNKQYMVQEDIPYTHELPVFGMKLKARGIENLYIPQFNVDVETFIEGMVTGDLDWSPKKGEKLTGEVIPHYDICWRCKEETGFILGIKVKDKKGRDLTFTKFFNDGVAELISKHCSNDFLYGYAIGPIKKRFSRTMQERYLSNGCVHCNAIMGNYYLLDYIIDYPELPAPLMTFDFINDDEAPYISSDWFFKGVASETLF